MLIGLDTNILVHATVIQSRVKHEKAKRFLEELVASGKYLISLQVIGEYYYTILRIAPSLKDEALQLIEILAEPQHLAHYNLQTLNEALRLTTSPRNFWDTLLALTYLGKGADAIATENEKDFKGMIRAVNPFK